MERKDLQAASLAFIMQMKGPAHWISLNLEEMGTTFKGALALCY